MTKLAARQADTKSHPLSQVRSPAASRRNKLRSNDDPSVIIRSCKTVTLALCATASWPYRADSSIAAKHRGTLEALFIQLSEHRISQVVWDSTVTKSLVLKRD
jgi:hypothetical protein